MRSLKLQLTDKAAAIFEKQLAESIQHENLESLISAFVNSAAEAEKAEEDKNDGISLTVNISDESAEKILLKIADVIPPMVSKMGNDFLETMANSLINGIVGGLTPDEPLEENAEVSNAAA